MSQQKTKDTAATAARAAVEAYGPSTRVVLRVMFLLLAVIAFVWILYKITGIILLLVLSIFFAYLVSPLVEFIRRPRTIGKRNVAIPKAGAIALAYLIILVVIVFAIFVVVPSLSNQFPVFVVQAKSYWESLNNSGQKVLEYSRSRRIPAAVVDLINDAGKFLFGKVGDTTTELVTAALGYLVYLPWLVLIPILAFFLLKDAEGFRRSALLMLPRGRWRWRGDEFFQDVNSTLAAYIRAQLTACLIVGLICSLGFTLLGLPGGLVMGVMAGLFEFVPLVGPVTIATVATALAMFQSGPFNAFLVLLFLGILRIAQDYAIYPRLIGQGIHLHPLAVIFAILAGEKLAGVAGIFLAIPVVAILTVSFKHWMEHRGSEGIADLLEPSSPSDPVKVAELAAKNAEELTAESTPEQMERARPDLTTGELKMPES